MNKNAKELIQRALEGGTPFVFASLVKDKNGETTGTVTMSVCPSHADAKTLLEAVRNHIEEEPA